ncbi:MAG: hypothetical protein AAF431_02745 [Pseudomonadota bacterium]
MLTRKTRYVFILFVVSSIASLIYIDWSYHGSKNNADASSSILSTHPQGGTAPRNIKGFEQIVDEEIGSHWEDQKSTVVEIGGRRIVVKFSVLIPKVLSDEIPSIPAEQLYDELSTSAKNGNREAALELAHELNRCRKGYSDKLSLRSAIEKLQDHGLYDSPDGLTKDFPIPQSERGFYVSHISREFKFCEGFSQLQLLESNEWAERSAAQGNISAMDFLVRIAIDSGDVAMEYKWHKAQWDRFGFIESADSITAMLMSGATPNGKPDYKKAYAYFLVYSKLKLASLGDKNEHYYNSLSAQFADTNTALSSKLSANEHLESEQLAADLIESNPNCCTSDNRYLTNIY